MLTPKSPIAVSVDDLDRACERFESKGVNWKKRLTDGRMKNVAFLLDPDGYWVEVSFPSMNYVLQAGQAITMRQVIQNEKLKPTSNW